MNKKRFVKVALNENIEVFQLYATFFYTKTIITIYIA